MRQNHSDFERFGTPPENILAATLRQPARTKKHDYNTRVPTRKEVSNLPLAELTPLLLGWMENSPVEIIPSRGQIQLVIEVLQQRHDTPALAALIRMCKNYAGSE
ncbi:MAG: hypothetical protein V4724_06740 [Pseudomonadota bacterium]